MRDMYEQDFFGNATGGTEPSIPENDHLESVIKEEDNDNIFAIMKEKKKKKKVEPINVKQSFYVHKELVKELDKLQRKCGHGFKTEFINLAIRNELKRSLKR
jgi:hypothetical protein